MTDDQTWDTLLDDTVDGTEVPTLQAQERALLGCAIGQPDVLEVVMRLLEPKHFWAPKHRTVYETMLDLTSRGLPVDNIYLAQAWEAKGILQDMGGSFYVTSLLVEACPFYYAEHYAVDIKEAWVKRELIQAGCDVASMAHNAKTGEGRGLLTFAQNLFETFDREMSEAETGNVEEALLDLSEPRPSGWSTGVPRMDEFLGGQGITGSRLTVLVGPTGAGKSWLVMSWVRACLEAGARVADFTLEMPRHERLARLAANSPYFGANALRLLGDPRQWSPADQAMFEEIRLWVRTFEGRYRLFRKQRSVEEIVANARSGAADVVVIDYYNNLARPAGCKDDGAADRHNSLALELAAERSKAAYVVLAQMDQVAVREVTAGVASQNSTIRWGKELGYRAAHELIISRDKSATPEMPVMRIEPRKNRYGRDSASRTAEEMLFAMDKSTGTITPVYGR